MYAIRSYYGGLDENQIIGNGLENKISSNSIKMPNKWIEYVKEYASKNGMRNNFV